MIKLLNQMVLDVSCIDFWPQLYSNWILSMYFQYWLFITCSTLRYINSWGMLRWQLFSYSRNSTEEWEIFAMNSVIWILQYWYSGIIVYSTLLVIILRASCFKMGYIIIYMQCIVYVSVTCACTHFNFGYLFFLFFSFFFSEIQMKWCLKKYTNTHIFKSVLNQYSKYPNEKQK